MKTKTLISVISALLVTVCCFAQTRATRTVRFETDGGSEIAALSLPDGSLIPDPAHPVKDGWAFVGWYTDPGASIRMWNFRGDRVNNNLTLYAGWVQVDEKHRLLNAYATAEELKNPYVAATLQTLGELSENQRNLSLPDGTTVYIAPGVYWTDLTYRQGFPFDDSGFVIAGPNTGLTIQGRDISFIGLTKDASDVRICGNRGEGGATGLGASGSWYTIAVGTGFHAENVSFANYAQEDLVYPRDPSQNISKRIDSKNHAEVMRTSERGADRISFDNVRLTGYLNMMYTFTPRRAYFKDCFLQCTDDSIFSGEMVVYENCTFHLFDNHPAWAAGGPGGINALLGCRLIGMTQMTHPFLSFSKMGSGSDGRSASAIYAVIDCAFSGRIETVEWENKTRPYARYAVYNNVIGDDKRPLTISAASPELSVDYGGKALEAFKVNGEYNIYNLLKGDDGWDPRGQHSAAWEPYSNLPFRFLLGFSGTTLYSGETGERNSVVMTPAVLPASSVDYSRLVWDYDTALLSGKVDPATGNLTLTALPNRDARIITTHVRCTLPTGVSAGADVEIYPVPVEPPVLKAAALSIGKGVATLSYKTDKPAYRDISKIDWYREKGPDTSDGIHVGTMMNDDEGLFMDDPFKSYPLTKYDAGYYLRAVITPKYEFSPYGETPLTVRSSRAVKESDVTTGVISTDFSHVVLAQADPAEAVGRWFFDGASTPWAWGFGTNGADGKWGLQNKDRQPVPDPLVFAQSGSYGDMSLTMDYSTGKVEGMGFGGNGNYIDILVKYDPLTRKGYGLHVQRVPATTNGNRWTLCRYDGNEREDLTEGQLSCAFMPGSTLTVSVAGNTLRVTASTTSQKTPLQIKENLPEKMDISWTDPSGALGADTNGSCAIRINNSGTASYRYTAGTNNCIMLHRITIDAKQK